ncbi:3D domain-containing protein [Candidatus Sumerlaeota bacterium]|nr:3D domain-containing protein [Candidatus Sumerlaeota bacterium]
MRSLQKKYCARRLTLRRCVFLFPFAAGLLFLFGLSGCRSAEWRDIQVTAYCGCGQCCSWERGRWLYLKMNFWNKYVAGGPNTGKPYSGRTASGTKPHTYHPGLFSGDTVVHPWMIPPRLVFFPWLFLPKKGTIAADTDYYPFGTEMYVPGYGWGIVEDRGSAIKGPDHIDVYFPSHGRALEWGRQTVNVTIMRDSE